MLTGEPRVILVGRQGPAFGDRPSCTHVKLLDLSEEEPGVMSMKLNNWPSSDRTDALRAVFDHLDSVLPE